MDSDTLDTSGIALIDDIDYPYDDNSIYEASMPHSIHHRLSLLLITMLDVFWGPINILVDYADILAIALVARALHIAIDSSRIRFKEKSKSFVTLLLGLYQLNRYLNRICQSHSCLTIKLIFSAIALAYIMILRIRNRTFTQPLLVAITLAPIIYNEFQIFHSKDEQQYCFLRGTVMTMTMKLLSLISWQGVTSGTYVIVAYLVHPASSVCGLWHKYDHVWRANTTRSALSILVKGLARDILKALLILAISTNLTDVIEHIELTNYPIPSGMKFSIVIYLTALEFRFSHYFACQLAATLLNLFPEYWPHGGQVITCHIWRVEWPRSLAEVVVSWNIPMHRWLKEIVFLPTLTATGSSLAAITATYLISSSLHGLKFHIWAVLLTFGALTFIEHNLRVKLAKRLRACVMGRKCRLSSRTQKNRCLAGHSLNKNYKAALINFSFRILAMIHLAYLGSVFVNNTDQASYKDALEIWSSQYYIGHVLGLVTLAITLML